MTYEKDTESMEDGKRKKIVFDIVNSVKGGSGKSTFSLLLGQYHASRNGSAAYIIDLDIRGTSWALDLQNFLFCEDGSLFNIMDPELIYVNDYIDDYSGTKYCRKFLELKIENKQLVEGAVEQPKVFLSIARPGVSDDMNELRKDLFENAIFRIIDEIYAIEAAHEEIDSVHIIFDMPPSYEPHAERILKHLISDSDSQLYKNIIDDKGKYKSFYRYVVNLYMVSALSNSHIEQNIAYIVYLLNKQAYSSALNEMLEHDRFKLLFVGNDVFNIEERVKHRIPDVRVYIKRQLDKMLVGKSVLSKDGNNFTSKASHFPVVGHMVFPYHLNFFANVRVAAGVLSFTKVVLNSDYILD